MTKLIIIADDFTGSLDTGVQFAKRGIDTLVTVMRDQPVDLHAACQVLVVNTESRHVTPEEAYRKVASIVMGAAKAGFRYIYKKTDSTLRGNIGSELAAVLENIPGTELVFIPAFPKSGRFTIRGQQYVGDTLLSETAFANDPFNPITQSGVREIIAEQTALSVENIFVDQFDRLKVMAKLPVSTELPASSETSGRAGKTPLKTIRVVDASCDKDLQQIGQVLKEAGKLHYLAGCAGFAELLPELLGLDLSTPPVVRPEGGTLLVSGSVNPMSLKQVHYAFDHCGFASSQLSVEQKINPEFVDHAWEEQLARQLAGLANGQPAEQLTGRPGVDGKAAVWSKRAESMSDDAFTRAGQLGIPAEDLAALIASNIGAIVKRTLNRVMVGTLIVFGGDTLLGIADKIGCHLMRPVREIVPGVVLAQFVDPRFKLNVVTKAGGFGGEDVVAHIDAYLAAI